jgi:hypothetical protein
MSFVICLKSGNAVNSRAADNISCTDNLSSAQCIVTDKRRQVWDTEFSRLKNTVPSPVTEVPEDCGALFLRFLLVLRSNLGWDED